MIYGLIYEGFLLYCQSDKRGRLIHPSTPLLYTCACAMRAGRTALCDDVVEKRFGHANFRRSKHTIILYHTFVLCGIPYIIRCLCRLFGRLFSMHAYSNERCTIRLNASLNLHTRAVRTAAAPPTVRVSEGEICAFQICVYICCGYIAAAPRGW